MFFRFVPIGLWIEALAARVKVPLLRQKTISPFEDPAGEAVRLAMAMRARMAELVGAERFLVAHVDAPVEVCRARDTSGIYARADAGEIAEVPGVTVAYDAPADADLRLPTEEIDIAEAVERLVALLDERGITR